MGLWPRLGALGLLAWLVWWLLRMAGIFLLPILLWLPVRFFESVLSLRSLRLPYFGEWHRLLCA